MSTRALLPLCLAGCSAILASPLTPAAHAQITGFHSGSGYTVNSLGPYTPVFTNGGSSVLLTTDTGVDDASSTYQGDTVFFDSRQGIDSFTAQFTYQELSPLSGSTPADGFAFIMQNDPRGVTALGDVGGHYGYSLNAGDAGSPIVDSAAIGFDVYSNPSINITPGTNLFTEGVNYDTNGNSLGYRSVAPVSLISGDPILINISYNGSTLTEKLTDTTTLVTDTLFYAVNLSSVIGSDTAYIGFGGGDGLFKSNQTISNFSFSGAATAPEPGVLPLFLLGALPIALARRRSRLSRSATTNESNAGAAS